MMRFIRDGELAAEIMISMMRPMIYDDFACHLNYRRKAHAPSLARATKAGSAVFILRID